jgi:hypothetical protein
MKKFYAFSISLVFGCLLTASAQNVSNTGFEDWENLGAETEEPTHWNSFKTAGGSLVIFAAQQLRQSPLTRPGSSGSFSALIWSRSTMSIVANGNMTTGKINMGNVVPTHQDNYNESVITDPLFCQAFTADPDSIAFWARFIPASGNTTDSARMRAVIHDAYNYKDPSTVDPDGPNHIVEAATVHFGKTDGQWVRQVGAFVAGPASTRAYALITFTTNKTAGGGSGGDSLYIDDLEMIYGSISIMEPEYSNEFMVFATSDKLVVGLNFTDASTTNISIYTIAGQLVLQNQKNISVSQETFELSQFQKGIYIVNVTRADGKQYSQKFAVR